MVDSEKVRELFYISSSEELTTKKLNEIGLNSNRINEYINNGIINRVSRGKYEILKNNLLNYIPNIYKELIELMNQSELGKFSSLLSLAFSNNKDINRVYLYLANLIYPISSELRDMLEQYMKDGLDIKEETDTSDYVNYIIDLILSKKYTYLINCVEKDIENDEDKLLLLLLEKIQKRYIIPTKRINALIYEKKYGEIVKLLDEEEKVIDLSYFKKILYVLSCKYIEIENVKDIPQKTSEISDDIISATKNNDFEKILSLSNQLDDIKLIKHKKLINRVAYDLYKITKKITFKDVIEEVEKGNSLIDIFNKIDYFLSCYDKQKYNSILIDTIKIDLFYNQRSYKKYSYSNALVNELINNVFKYDMNYYIKSFYYELSKGHIDIAQTYLDIIDNGKYLGYECPIYDLFEQALFYTKKLYNHEEIDIIKLSDTSEINSNDSEDEEFNNQEEIVRDEVVNTIDSTYLDAQIEKVRELKGIVPLKKINGDRLSLLRKKIKGSDDLLYLKIRDRYTLIYAPNKRIRDNYVEYINKGEELYKESKYEEAVVEYKKVLWSGSAKAYTYARIGLCYLKMSHINKCLEYLKIATELSRIEGKNFDFSVLIAQLTNSGMVDEEDTKFYVKFNENDFYEDKYYGISCMSNIIDNIRNGMSIEESFILYNLDEEQSLVALLVLAKEYYKVGEFELGDTLYKKVEKHNNKSRKVIKIMNEIQRNKKFYMYREDNQNILIKK